MEHYDAETGARVMEKTVMIGSVLSGVALFVLSVVIVMMIGFFMGALALTERIASQCSDDEEQQYSGELAANPTERYDDEQYEADEPYEHIEAGVVLSRGAFGQAV